MAAHADPWPQAFPLPTGESLAAAVTAARQQVTNHAGSNTGAVLADLPL
jgi:hypothetical protein